MDNNKIEFELSAYCSLAMYHLKDTNVSKLKSVEFQLEISKNLDPTLYVDEDGNHTIEGIKCLTNIFTQALIANLHNAHQRGLWDDVEHLKFIRSELDRGFVENVDFNLDE